MSRNSTSALLVALSALLIAAVAIGVAAVALSGGPSGSRAAGAPGAGEAPRPGNLPAGSRLVIPAIGVDADLIVVGVDAAGVMGTPDNGLDAGWYDFSALPGEPGNTVLTGHVDYYDIGPAVFWRLRDLRPGDEVQVRLGSAGDAVRYAVTAVESYEAGAAPVNAIVGPSEDDILTLITCDGWFNPAIREYDHRLIVRAARAP